VGDGIDYAAEREIVIGDRGLRSWFAGTRASRVIVGQVEQRELGKLVGCSLPFRKLVKFAEELVGAYCTVPLGEARALPDDRYYHFQLVGLRVFDIRSARELGQVVEVLTYPANDVLRVTNGANEVLIPMIRSVVRAIAPSEGRITVELDEETQA